MQRGPEQTKREEAVFEYFLEASRAFKAQAEGWGPADEEPADITAKLKTSGSVGFQLGELLHTKQMAMAKRKERLRRELQQVLRPCLRARPGNFERVGIFVRAAKWKPQDAAALRGQFQGIASNADQGWHADPRRWPGGYALNQFLACPVVSGYVERMLFRPPRSQVGRVSEALARVRADPEVARLWEQSCQEARARVEAAGLRADDAWPADSWIRLLLEGGTYNSEPALEAVKDILCKKNAGYRTSPSGDLRLIIHYNDAVR